MLWFACATPTPVQTCDPVEGTSCYVLDASAGAAIVTVRTEAPGLGPELVESAVSEAIEAAVAPAPGVERVMSQSGAWVSTVTVYFASDVPAGVALTAVSDRLVGTRLPQGLTPYIDLLDGCWRPTTDDRAACIARDACAAGRCTKWASCSGCEPERR